MRPLFLQHFPHWSILRRYYIDEKSESNTYGTHREAFAAIIEGAPFEKGSPLTEAPPLSLRDISPHCGESLSNSLPKTSVFIFFHIERDLFFQVFFIVRTRSIWKKIR